MTKERNRSHWNRTCVRLTRFIRRIAARCVCYSNDNTEEMLNDEKESSEFIIATPVKYSNVESALDGRKIMNTAYLINVPDPNDFIDIHQFDHLLKKKEEVEK